MSWCTFYPNTLSFVIIKWFLDKPFMFFQNAPTAFFDIESRFSVGLGKESSLIC